MKIWVAVGTAVCFVLSVRTGAAQAQAGAPVFEVASIRAASAPTPDRIRSGQFRAGARVNGNTLDFGFVSLADLLPYAFRVKSFQVVSPAWTRESRWNILAKLPEGNSKDQVPEMIQALLTERFKLTVHHEKRDLPVYVLELGKGRPKLEAVAEGNDSSNDAANEEIRLPGLFPGPPFGGGPPGGGRGPEANGDGRGGRGPVVPFGGGAEGVRISPGANCGMRLEFSKVTMGVLADTLTPFLDRPVLDGTELKGAYKAELNLPMEAMFAMMQNLARGRGPGFGGPGPGFAGPGPGDGGGRGGRGGGPQGCGDPAAAFRGDGADSSSAGIFEAVKQLGLKLEPRKTPFDAIIVDHLERQPTEN